MFLVDSAEGTVRPGAYIGKSGAPSPRLNVTIEKQTENRTGTGKLNPCIPIAAYREVFMIILIPFSVSSIL